MSLSLAPIILLASAQGMSYHVTVTGPSGQMDTICGDPCDVEQVEVVGTAGGGTTINSGQSENDGGRSETEGVDCQGSCAGRTTEINFTIQTRRTLREGIELSIDGGRAHFIFYDVVEAENGSSTRKRHAEFNLDRDLIELRIHGSSVRIEAVEAAEDT